MNDHVVEIFLSYRKQDFTIPFICPLTVRSESDSTPNFIVEDLCKLICFWVYPGVVCLWRNLYLFLINMQNEMRHPTVNVRVRQFKETLCCWVAWPKAEHINKEMWWDKKQNNSFKHNFNSRQLSCSALICSVCFFHCPLFTGGSTRCSYCSRANYTQLQVQWH